MSTFTVIYLSSSAIAGIVMGLRKLVLVAIVVVMSVLAQHILSSVLDYVLPFSQELIGKTMGTIAVWVLATVLYFCSTIMLLALVDTWMGRRRVFVTWPNNTIGLVIAVLAAKLLPVLIAKPTVAFYILLGSLLVITHKLYQFFHRRRVQYG